MDDPKLALPPPVPWMLDVATRLPVLGTKPG
jgi:hypothetical protein